MTPWTRMVTSEAGCFISRAGIIWCLVEYGLSEKREKSGMIWDVWPELLCATIMLLLFSEVQRIWGRLGLQRKLTVCMDGLVQRQIEMMLTYIIHKYARIPEKYTEKVSFPSLPFTLPTSFSLSSPLLFFILIVLGSGDQTQCSTRCPTSALHSQPRTLFSFTLGCSFP